MCSMRHVIRWSCLATALLAFGTPLEAQDKPKPAGKGTAASAQEYQAVLSNGELTGKIARIDQTKRLITVVVETQAVQAGNGQGNQNAIQNALRQQEQAIRQL